MLRLLIAGTLALAFLAAGVWAHGPYIGKVDPAYGNNCCGGSDCAPLPAAWLKEVQAGFNVIMSIEQARTINPLAMMPIDAVVPHARIQPSWDSDFHVCIFPKDRSAPRGGVICFFAPLTT